MCRDWGTNTRKIKSNIDKYIKGDNKSNIYYQQKICVMSYIELTLLIAFCGLDCATCEADRKSVV